MIATAITGRITAARNEARAFLTWNACSVLNRRFSAPSGGCMRRLACVFILIVCAGPVMAFGQAASANLTGTARDASGAVLPGVTITAVHAGTNDTRTTVTSVDGLYRLTNLPRGTYSVSAELQGFKTLTQASILLTVGETVRLDFVLEVGTVAETVTVQGHSPLINTEEGRISYLVDEKRVAELPLNGRNALQLIELQPGSAANPGAVLGGS